MSSIETNNIFEKRQEKLTSEMDKAGLTAVAINPGPSLIYLTGLHFHLSERPVVAIFSPGKPVAIALPELEARKVENLSYKTHCFLYDENPNSWTGTFRQAALAAKIGGGKIGVEPRQFRYLELKLMEQAAENCEFVSAEDILAVLRMQKDDAEIAAMRQAVQIAQAALRNTIPSIRIGMTEKELASELVNQLLRAGTSGDMPFMPIVSGGPNSANPHATPSERPLLAGDLLVIDWGASYGGYVSDLTRTFAIGEVEPEFRRIAEVVLEANAAGREAGKPGMPAKNVDIAARNVIDQAGYGLYFTHRTGHGLGMEGHEPPYMRGDNEQILLPGMTYTVEPGIYLPNRGGVRIEDDMVVTAQGAESLSDFPRELAIVHL
jgi:Xaa-Pro dipeptidase